MLWASFAALICPCGTRIAACKPARAAYAARLAAVFPVLAQTAVSGAQHDGLRDRRRHARIFKDPVGLHP